MILVEGSVQDVATIARQVGNRSVNIAVPDELKQLRCRSR
jgi:hypothetical protein